MCKHIDQLIFFYSDSMYNLVSLTLPTSKNTDIDTRTVLHNVSSEAHKVDVSTGVCMEYVLKMYLISDNNMLGAQIWLILN